MQHLRYRRESKVVVRRGTRVIVAMLALAGGGQLSDQRSVAFVNVTVIDVIEGRALPQMDVLMRGDAITLVAPYTAKRIASGVRVVDGTDKFLMPGLWDMHVHWSDSEYLPLFIANGVTGIRQMSGMPIQHEWETRLESGSIIGPRQQIGSAIIDGPKPVWPGSVAVSTPDDAIRAVQNAKRGGAAFIKTYSLLSRDVYTAIAREAPVQHLPLVGHVPYAVSLVEASGLGHRTVEHLTGMLLAASTREEEFRRALTAALASAKPVLSQQRSCHPMRHDSSS